MQHFVLVFPSGIGYTIIMAVSPGDKKGDTFEYSIKKLDYCNRQRSTVRCLCHIHLTRDDLIGSFPWRGNLDLLNIILIGLTDELPEHDDTYELHRLLGALLSQNLPVEQKLAIIDREYDIPLEHEFRKEVDTMCSLSQGIKEEGIAIGEARGESRGIAIGESRGETKIILTMYRNGLSAEQISAATDKSIEDITSIIEQKDSVPVS